MKTPSLEEMTAKARLELMQVEPTPERVEALAGWLEHDVGRGEWRSGAARRQAEAALVDLAEEFSAVVILAESGKAVPGLTAREVLQRHNIDLSDLISARKRYSRQTDAYTKIAGFET